MRAMVSRSPLALLVALVLADHQHHPVAADDLAFLAHRLDRRSYLHDPFRRLGSGGPALAAVAAAATGSRICPCARKSRRTKAALQMVARSACARDPLDERCFRAGIACPARALPRGLPSAGVDGEMPGGQD